MIIKYLESWTLREMSYYKLSAGLPSLSLLVRFNRCRELQLGWCLAAGWVRASGRADATLKLEQAKPRNLN